MTAVTIKTDSFYNPLDMVETVIMDRDWVFDRPDDGELLAEAAGHWCKYQMWFKWEEDYGGLTLTSTLDAKFPKPLTQKVHTLLALANEKLWLGHFETSSEELSVSFRHALLLKHGASVSTKQLQDLIDIALEESERLYPAFQSVVWGGKSPEEAMLMAMFETVAEA